MLQQAFEFGAIVLADLSMSIDSLLAVAAIFEGNPEMPVFDLGLAVLLYVVGGLLYRGFIDPETGTLMMSGGVVS